MFTLEDVDLHDDLEFIREHAARFLPTQAGAVEADTAPEADASNHPQDYFIAR
ncbi:hypothetical protein [Gephyromycinifex aptenodytis]|uniref:hypothetical protein n=1 Tax=Gephyromycinifex aptenodytis TaxID=2716227 RepID=UPI001445D6DA|nr:hypothetical protein [Gephyromycinifex aptenodytis]